MGVAGTTSVARVGRGVKRHLFVVFCFLFEEYTARVSQRSSVCSRIKDKTERWTLVPQSVQGSVIPLDYRV
jgi:hypothetical protein